MNGTAYVAMIMLLVISFLLSIIMYYYERNEKWTISPSQRKCVDGASCNSAQTRLQKKSNQR